MKAVPNISGMEFRVYLKSRELDKNIISINDIQDILKVSRKKAYNILYKMNKKGLIKRSKNGIYIFDPHSFGLDLENYLEDPFFILKNQVEPYFVSHYSALMLHGLAQQWTNRYFITTFKRIKPVHNEFYSIKPVIVLRENFFGFIETKYGNELIKVSDLERTVLDIMNKPEYAGGFGEVITCLLDIEKLNFNIIDEYLKKLNKKILYHRIGYLFDSPVFKANFDIPNDFLEEIKRHIHSITYFDRLTKTGDFNNTWKVYVPRKIENGLRRW